ncbi:hypothetical protein SO802_033772 [Lithocarpus litseifolius]|uniref:Uncharacterized protein n=1 Tax=Lithocarpus litseifolius TaxID=425828 RepID=A0AAW2BGQ6_9ROSI
MGHTSKDLLHLEHKNPSTSTLESTLFVCKKVIAPLPQKAIPDGNPITAPVPKSQEAPHELFVKFVQDACIASLIVTLPLQLPKIEASSYFSSWCEGSRGTTIRGSKGTTIRGRCEGSRGTMNLVFLLRSAWAIKLWRSEERRESFAHRSSTPPHTPPHASFPASENYVGAFASVVSLPQAMMQTGGFEYFKENCPTILIEILEYVARVSEHSIIQCRHGNET